MIIGTTVETKSGAVAVNIVFSSTNEFEIFRSTFRRGHRVGYATEVADIVGEVQDKIQLVLDDVK